MGGAAPILLRFIVACRPRAWPVRCSCVLVRVRPPVATPVRAGGGGRGGARRADRAAPPPPPPSRSLQREGGRPPGPGKRGGPTPPWPAGRGGAGGGGGGAPLFPAPLPCGLALGPRPCHSSPLAQPPWVYTCGRGCRAVVGARRGPVGHRWVSVAVGGVGEDSSPRSAPPPFPGLHQSGPLRLSIPGCRRSVAGRQRVLRD